MLIGSHSLLIFLSTSVPLTRPVTTGRTTEPGTEVNDGVRKALQWGHECKNEKDVVWDG